MDLITLLVSEDEGCNWHMINVLCDPLHLAHHPVHLAEKLACDMLSRSDICVLLFWVTCYDDNCGGNGGVQSLSPRNQMC